jgi:hypothetical protein
MQRWIATFPASQSRVGVKVTGRLSRPFRDLRRARRGYGYSSGSTSPGWCSCWGPSLNAEIEYASPYGKAAGEKVPGPKRAIGALGYRRYLAGPVPASRPLLRTTRQHARSPTNVGGPATFSGGSRFGSRSPRRSVRIPVQGQECDIFGSSATVTMATEDGVCSWHSPCSPNKSAGLEVTQDDIRAARPSQT